MLKQHLLFAALLFSISTFAQGEKDITATAAGQASETKTKGVFFGFSIGFNRSFGDLYDTRISPLDSTLRFQKTSNLSFLLSTTVTFPITKGLGGRYYQKLDDKGNVFGPAYFVPYGLAFVGTINLATFNSALGGAGLFNQKLDGGLGLAYTFSENVQIALTYEMISFRQPRKFLLDYQGKQLKVNGEPLAALATDDNNYFTDNYNQSVSLKIIYPINK